MDVQGTLSSSWNTFTQAASRGWESTKSGASSAWESTKSGASQVCEQGKLGSDFVVSKMKESPRNATIAAVATLATAVGAAYISGAFSTEAGTDIPDPKGNATNTTKQ